MDHDKYPTMECYIILHHYLVLTIHFDVPTIQNLFVSRKTIVSFRSLSATGHSIFLDPSCSRLSQHAVVTVNIMLDV